MKTYTVRATRSGDWWAIDAPELPGVHSQARRLDQAETMAREAIALVLEIDPASFDVTVQPVLPRETQVIIDEVRRTRDTAAIAAEQAAHTIRKAAQILHDQERLPLRDVGRILGVSHQRAHQLLNGSEPPS